MNAWKNVFSVTENIPCSLLAKREKFWRLILQLDVRSFLKKLNLATNFERLFKKSADFVEVKKIWDFYGNWS